METTAESTTAVTTIAAIATPLGTSGVGMVRLSGPQSVSIAAGMIRSGRDIRAMKGYTGCYGRVYDEEGDIDEAVLFVYRAPHSYTGEDSAEICCHGGPYLLRRVLRRCLELGASPAGPGEVTRRAVRAGKLSLTQAEAVMGLVSSSGRQAAAAALAARDGSVYRAIHALCEKLVHAAAALAAWVDYPEEEHDAVFSEDLCRTLRDVQGELEKLLRTAERGALVREGVLTAIVGRPNVGKSTLMNRLTGEETSIVADEAGTTRDVVECRVNVGDVPLCLWDTAGLRTASGKVEAAGVARARQRLERAQLVLAVFDGSVPLTEEDEALLCEIRDRPAVAVVNKADLGGEDVFESVRSRVPEAVRLSALTGEGEKALEESILRVLALDTLETGAAVLAGERQCACAARARDALRDAVGALEDGITLDAAGVLVDEAIDALLSLTGERAGEAVVDEVFSHFCVGK